jgi:DNA-binding GntR family transcriptional regulator
VAKPRLSVEQVVQQLRERIALHAIPPHARLREWEIASEFGVPRLSAREALDRLAQLGFLDRQPNRGVVVHRFDLEELVQVYDLREVNEGLCARLAARHAAPERWNDLIALFGKTMAQVIAKKQFDAYSMHYEKLRKRLIELAASPPLAELLERLNDVTLLAGRRMLLVSDRTAHALREHRALLTALRNRDEEAAEHLRRTTIRNVKDAVVRYHSFLL